MSQTTHPGLSNVPDVTWRYWGILEFMQSLTSAIYGMDARRTECHEELCAYYKLTKEKTKEVTDYMDKLENAFDLHEALTKLRENK